jgi:hypothetical protein
MNSTKNRRNFLDGTKLASLPPTVRLQIQIFLSTEKPGVRFAGAEKVDRTRKAFDTRQNVHREKVVDLLRQIEGRITTESNLMLASSGIFWMR